MTKDVQQQGGTFEEQSVFIGLPRQLTIDTTNWRILLHDGITEGGRLFVPRDEGDARWMPIIEELLGWDEFLPNVKGMAMRSAPGVWAIRQLVGTVGAIDVTDGNGVAGNPTINLPDEITKSLTVSGNWIFETNLTAPEFVGDLNGDSNGTHTGDVVGNVTGDLEGDTTGTHIGPVDLRGADDPAFQSDAGAIPQASVNGLVAALATIPPALPTGVITMWYGNTGNVPSGWFLCDGQNGTPDLRNKFILGAGDDYESHDVGGADSFTPGGTIAADGTHTHTGTVASHTLTESEIPSHKHANGVVDNSTGIYNHSTLAANPTSTRTVDGSTNTGTIEGYTSNTGGGSGHTHGLTIDNAGSHTHTFSGIEAASLPPYYALCYIMKG